MKLIRFRIITLSADIVILAISFLIVMSTKPAGIRGYLASHLDFFAVLSIIWLTVSLLNGKMHRGKIVNFTTMVTRVISSNIISIAITVLLMYSFREDFFSRRVVLGTAAVATLLELLAGFVYMAYRKATVHPYEVDDPDNNEKKKSEFELVKEANGHNHFKEVPVSQINPRIITALEKECGKEITREILRMAGTEIGERTSIVSTTTSFNIDSLPQDRYDYIINLRRINAIPQLNQFLDSVNSKLEQDGLFFCCVETKDQRKARLLKKYPAGLNYIFYFFDFIVKRVLPKLKITAGLYNFFNHGSNAVISRAEALGRLSRAGFRIRQESFIGNLLCIEARKYRDPFPVNGKIYGPLIALPRIGKNGDIIKVYKLRTMHPYSEYIQDYVYRLSQLQDGGKFRNDFRITSWGAFCRKVWLDEVPMIINHFKGNMKLVGVRPLSKQYFGLYNKELQERRIQYKPGLIPPFYADLPSNLEEIQQSELKYLDAYDKNPVRTDLDYLSRSIWNIIVRKARSN